jgi:hypothetical protein
VVSDRNQNHGDGLKECSKAHKDRGVRPFTGDLIVIKPMVMFSKIAVKLTQPALIGDLWGFLSQKKQKTTMMATRNAVMLKTRGDRPFTGVLIAIKHTVIASRNVVKLLQLEVISKPNDGLKCSKTNTTAVLGLLRVFTLQSNPRKHFTTRGDRSFIRVLITRESHRNQTTLMGLIALRTPNKRPVTAGCVIFSAFLEVIIVGLIAARTPVKGLSQPVV